MVPMQAAKYTTAGLMSWRAGRHPSAVVLRPQHGVRADEDLSIDGRTMQGRRERRW
jgi:hypothetical protein